MSRTGDRIGELFALSPPEFVKRRDALAGELKREGEITASLRVRALRRPGLATWAMNQVARESPESFDALVENGGVG